MRNVRDDPTRLVLVNEEDVRDENARTPNPPPRRSTTDDDDDNANNIMIIVLLVVVRRVVPRFMACLFRSVSYLPAGTFTFLWFFGWFIDRPRDKQPINRVYIVRKAKMSTYSSKGWMAIIYFFP